jgi:hypothetical protein
MNNNNNFKKFIENLCTKQIDFISNIPKEIYIDKRGQALYFKMFGLEINKINNFIYNISDNEVLLIIPFITKTNTIKDPYICLSSQFLLSNNSDPILIYRFLSEQLNKAYEDYMIDHDKLEYSLYFKHKKVNLTYKEF